MKRPYLKSEPEKTRPWLRKYGGKFSDMYTFPREIRVAKVHVPIHGVREMDDDGDLWRLDLTGLERNN
jgi:hypothetical protein